MRPYRCERLQDGSLRLLVPYRGAELLTRPLYNKGTAFTPEERTIFAVEGLLPDVVSSMDQQAERVYGHITRKTDPLEQYIGLSALQDRNEHLFYRVLLDHLEEFLPIVYTPTVGQASIEYSHIFRRGRGLWITPAHRGRIASILDHTPYSDVRLIVVTDNEAILGLGDQGAGGIVIPIGKLAIYSAAAGIHPARTLPVSLDFGTNNEALLADELYVGWPHRRLEGEAYDTLVEEFVEAVSDVFPRALIQWEDFSKESAWDLLGRYRDRVLSFNDDIQGTGATALAGFLAADRAAGRRFADHRVVIVGGGAAGAGIAAQLESALTVAGVPGEELRARIAVLDSRGLIVEDRPGLDEYKRAHAWPRELVGSLGLDDDLGLAAVVRALRPTALIGTSGQPGMFTREIVESMAAHVERPIVMPFSNPTSKAEAKPQEVLEWTGGRAQVATGSPFPAVTLDGRRLEIGQGNNALIFPAMGLGALVAQAGKITDGMFTAAAKALAATLAEDELGRGRLYPAIRRLRDVTREVAVAIVRQARDEGVGQDIEDAAIPAAVDAAMWEPVYPKFVPE